MPISNIDYFVVDGLQRNEADRISFSKGLLLFRQALFDAFHLVKTCIMCDRNLDQPSACFCTSDLSKELVPETLMFALSFLPLNIERNIILLLLLNNPVDFLKLHGRDHLPQGLLVPHFLELLRFCHISISESSILSLVHVFVYVADQLNAITSCNDYFGHFKLFIFLMLFKTFI